MEIERTTSRCQKLVNGQPCFASNTSKQANRRVMHPPDDSANRRLRYANSAGELGLCKSVLSQVGAKSFHAARVSFPSMKIAIGQFYLWPGDAARMAVKRSFFDRAMEALKERYPRQKPTQELLAGLAGVKQPSVNAWRNGYPSMETAIRLAMALDVCVEWLLTERGPKRPGKPDLRDMDQLEPTWAKLTVRQRTEVARYADYLSQQGHESQ